MSRDGETKAKFPSSPPPSGPSTSPPPSGPSTSPPPSGTTSLSGAFPQEVRPRQATIPPSDLETLTESYAKRPPDGFSPEQAILGKIADLEEWAQQIARQERGETFRFWVMKGLSFFAGVATASGGALGLSRLAVACGIITAVSIAVDAAWPVSGDRNARRRAVHDLRELEHALKLKWEKVRLAHPDPYAVKRVAHALALLDSTQAKREQIGTYLGEASPAVRKA